MVPPRGSAVLAEVVSHASSGGAMRLMVGVRVALRRPHVRVPELGLHEQDRLWPAATASDAFEWRRSCRRTHSRPAARSVRGVPAVADVRRVEHRSPAWSRTRAAAPCAGRVPWRCASSTSASLGLMCTMRLRSPFVPPTAPPSLRERPTRSVRSRHPAEPRTRGATSRTTVPAPRRGATTSWPPRCPARSRIDTSPSPGPPAPAGSNPTTVVGDLDQQRPRVVVGRSDPHPDVRGRRACFTQLCSASCVSR